MCSTRPSAMRRLLKACAAVAMAATLAIAGLSVLAHASADAMTCDSDTPYVGGLDQLAGWGLLFQEEYDDADPDPELLPAWDYSEEEFSIGTYDDASAALVQGRGFLDFLRPWTDYATVTRLSVMAGSVTLSYRRNEGGRYFVEIAPDSALVYLGKTHILPGRPRGWAQRDHVASAPLPLVFGEWYEVAVIGDGATIEVLIDGVSVLTFVDPDPWLEGGIGFETIGDAPHVIVDFVRAWCPGTAE